MDTLDLIFEDILFSHYEYSPILFDSMHEFLMVCMNDEKASDKILWQRYGLTLGYVFELKQQAKFVRHQMRVEKFIETHNKLIEPFNLFLKRHTKYPPLMHYKAQRYEIKMENLAIHHVLDEMGILKLYEQYLFMQGVNHGRKDLRLQMFFESTFRLWLNKSNKETFHQIITDHASVEVVLLDLMDSVGVSKSLCADVSRDLMTLNAKRNRIKHAQDYRYRVNYERLERIALLVVRKLKARIEPYNQVVFKNKQALLEYHLAFRELSFDYKLDTLERLGRGLLVDEETVEALQYDRAFHAFYLEEMVKGDFMKLIYDYERIQKTITDFHGVVEKLDQVNEFYSDTKDTIDSTLKTFENFNEINQKLNTLARLDTGKLAQLIRLTSRLPGEADLEKLVHLLTERLEDLKEGNTLLKNHKKALKNLVNQIDKLQE